MLNRTPPPHQRLGCHGRMVRSGNVKVITGDWLSEMNIAWNAITQAGEVDPDLGYENDFF